MSSQQLIREAGPGRHGTCTWCLCRAEPCRSPLGRGGGAARAPRPLGLAGMAGFELQALWFVAADFI